MKGSDNVNTQNLREAVKKLCFKITYLVFFPMGRERTSTCNSTEKVHKGIVITKIGVCIKEHCLHCRIQAGFSMGGMLFPTHIYSYEGNSVGQ